MNRYGYMGVDIGTSGCKAAVFDENGNQLAAAYREYGVISSQTGWAELNADEVINKCFEVISQSAADSKTDIAGLAIASQGEAFTPIDSSGNPLCNAIVSSDNRAADYAVNWTQDFGKNKLYQITGHTAHPLFSLFKLLWLKDNRKDIFEKAYKFLCFEDLLQYRLGLQPSMGYPLAARTMLFDVRRHCWSNEILDKLGLAEDKLAATLKSGTVCGNISKPIASKLGLSNDAFVVCGGHDQPCCGLGVGAVDAGDAVYSLGTVECITPAFEKANFNETLQKSNLCTYDHVVDNRYATVAYSLTGGNLLKWFKDEFAAVSYRQMFEAIPKAPTDLLVLPYFTPTGTPYFDTQTSGMIYGLRLTTGSSDILRALVEGVGLEMKLNLDILSKAGCKVNRLIATGGGAKSPELLQIKADILGVEINTVDVNEAGCKAMAMLVYKAQTNMDIKSIISKWVKINGAISPQSRFNGIYTEKLEKYKEAYKLAQNLAL